MMYIDGWKMLDNVSFTDSKSPITVQHFWVTLRCPFLFSQDSFSGGSPLLLGSVERISAALTDTLDGKERAKRSFIGRHIGWLALTHLLMRTQLYKILLQWYSMCVREGGVHVI